MSADAPGGLPAEVARFLRQRAELGGPELFLEDLSRDRALRLARMLRERGVAGASRIGDEASGDASTVSAAGEATGAGGAEESGADAPGADEAGREPGAPGQTPAEHRRIQEGAAGEEAIRSLDYPALEEVALGCERCRLSEERRQVVFSDGDPEGRLMVVGEAPGAREDRTGLPFVGPAGKLLDLVLAAVDLSREESVYICNVIKCRPPGNRNPLPDEIESCAPYLRRQIELVEPEVILAVGTFAGQLLTGRSSTLGNLRGEVYSYEGVPLVVTYHPAALLRNRSWTRSTWDDLQLLRQIMDGG